ncbi:hypothetical protein QO231_23980 [Sedimentitalea todarodis]|uniref:Uncharacterized protein n=1 Tax=Sedimentitalea todarodis TaxID=1631240 RepID=A0ABU3VL58_9RHOB|nr:hypothetical protein [Sedimentitalea todarodis]MDU9006896.1 hypothetical protein [Sedimentitalea todarodis]
MNLPKLPDWVTSGRAETLDSVAFRSGAVLVVLDQLVSDQLDLSRYRAAPSARLSHFSFECDGTFPAQC